jgi:AraC-like DNA-binding protein
MGVPETVRFEARLIDSLTVEVEAAGMTPVPNGHSTGWRVLPALLVAQGRNCRIRVDVERAARVQTCETRPGGALLIAPGMRHRAEVFESQGGASWWSHLNVRVLGSVSLLDFYDVPALASRAASPELGDANARLSQLLGDGGALTARIEIQEIGLRLLRLVLSQATLRPSYQAFEEGAARLAPVLAFIQQHVQEPLTRDDLAERAHMSPSRFHVAFRRVMGVPPLQYVARIRLRRAQQMLVTTDHTVAEVGEACGYPDAFHFSRLFKREIGIGPLAYRKQGLAWFSGSRPAARRNG